LTDAAIDLMVRGLTENAVELSVGIFAKDDIPHHVKRVTVSETEWLLELVRPLNLEDTFDSFVMFDSPKAAQMHDGQYSRSQFVFINERVISIPRRGKKVESDTVFAEAALFPLQTLHVVRKFAAGVEAIPYKAEGGRITFPTFQFDEPGRGHYICLAVYNKTGTPICFLPIDEYGNGEAVNVPSIEININF